MFIYGPGANGKTTFAETLSGIMGEYAVTARMETFTAAKYSAHPTEIARLEPARLVTASETESGRHWAESRIKSLTGGDRIAARYMRQNFFEFTPRFKLLFVGNHRPSLLNVDEPARRRFMLVPFEFQPSIRDNTLPEKLRAEWPGILHWMIRGCLDWKESGPIRPKAVADATESYFESQDIFGQWLADCTTRKGELTGETSQALFNSWKRYAVAQDERVGTRTDLADRMVRRGYKKVTHTPGLRGKRGFLGIMLNPVYVPEDWPS